MSISILHTGDEHIDSDVHGTLNARTGRSTAWESNYATIRHLAEQAVARGVSAFISSGDEFKTGRPSQEALLMLADAYTPLAEAGIPVLLLDGNHNRIGVTSGHRSAIWALAEILRARGGIAHASATPELVRLGGIQVATLPWLNTNAVLGAHALSPREADRKVAEHAIAELDRLASTADAGIPLVMAGHVTAARPVTDTETDGTRRGSERELTHLFSEPILDVTQLEQLPYRYGALGHIHTPQTIGAGGIYRYAGSPNRLTFTDEPDTKGGNLVTLGGDGTLAVEQVVTPARALTTVDLDTDDRDGALAGVREGALVRVRLAPGDIELDRSVRARITGAGAHIVGTEPRPEQRPRPRTRTALGKTVDADTALRTWAKANSTLDADTLVTAAAKLVS
jgi:DNA repair exonuclease SbcCD nuclease subunit